ncbi:MAG: cyclin-dependent kinase inhibitor 3 family protein [Pseudomonadales bacterium]|nr:cyclin-dependent kinase inhibitor 3 family protein [Pseudomonadales bacterium]
MSHDASFELNTMTELFNLGMISAPLAIRADLGDRCVEAVLSESGAVQIVDESYFDIHQAMLAIRHDGASTSDAWQFWSWFSPERLAWAPLEHLRAKLQAQSSQTDIRTSDTHPLRIDYVSVPNVRGKVGLTFCPGKRCEGLYGGTWERDLAKDLAVIESLGGKVLVTLMEQHEFAILGVREFPNVLDGSTIEWLHLPILDMNVPDDNFEHQWRMIGPRLHARLAEGDIIVIHCRGGLGRTGLIAARMLVEAGLSPVDAVAAVRSAREHSIETYAQEHYVLSKGWER